MARPKLSGEWEGRYWFDSNSGIDLPTEPTPFGMDLKQSCLFASLKGDIWEHPPGVRDRGRIEGEIVRGRICFVKRMPVYRLRIKGESLTFKEYAERTWGMPVDRDPAHPLLLYNGDYDSETGEMAGAWKFIQQPTYFRSNGVWMTVDEPIRETGRWSARRVR